MVETVEENVSGSCESAQCFRKTVLLSGSKIPRRSCKWPFAQERVFDCVDEHFFFLKKRRWHGKWILLFFGVEEVVDVEFDGSPFGGALSGHSC